MQRNKDSSSRSKVIARGKLAAVGGGRRGTSDSFPASPDPILNIGPPPVDTTLEDARRRRNDALVSTASTRDGLLEAPIQKRLNRASRRANGFAISRDLAPTLVSVDDLHPLGRQTRKHPRHQIDKLARSLETFGFVAPIIADSQNRVVAGMALVLAAKALNIPEVPVVYLTDLSEAQARALRLALNRLPEDSSWDDKQLAVELREIIQLEPTIDLLSTGFEMAETDLILDDGGIEQEDELPTVDENMTPVSRVGDVWKLGDHVVICGDALDHRTYVVILGSDKSAMVFADAPYNVKIVGHVTTRSKPSRSHDFPMAKGELSPKEFESFLATSLGLAARFSRDGAIHFVCMDWRHLDEISAAGREIYGAPKNLVVWNKTNAGMGSFYRSQHELIFVFKVGKAPHINNIQLGRFGRNRSNVWSYPGQTSLSATAKSKLSLHPTVKPVAMVADAIRDCSNRGDIILDPFGGAGTTLIAAEKTGRRARLIELNPIYVDVTIERWQRLTGGTAFHAGTGQSFADEREERDRDA